MHGNIPCIISKEQHLFENQSQDTRYKGPLDVSPMLPAQLGTGGNNTTPFVVEQTPFCKAGRARSADDATTWKDGKVANTLNTFDTGEARANELVVESQIIPIHDMATRYSGKRGDKSNGKGNGLGVGQDGDPMNTLTSADRHAVAYSMQPFGDYKKSDKSSALKARDYKNATDLVCCVDCRNATEYPELNGTPQAKSGGGTSLNCNQVVRVRYIVRRLTPTECARLQAFADQWGHIEQKHNLTNEEYEFWCKVNLEYSAIQGTARPDGNGWYEIWREVKPNKKKGDDFEPYWENTGKPYTHKTRKAMLTWYNKLWTDSAEYKMWGNGIALPPALYVMQGIADALYHALVRANLPEYCTEE